MNSNIHYPVLWREVINFLKDDYKLVIDATIGTGALSYKILERFKNIKIYGIDIDQQSIQFARKYLERFKSRVKFFNKNFKNIKEILLSQKINMVDAVIFDLGISKFQLNSNRGFSFNTDSFLDMRLDKNLKTTAFKILNFYDRISLEKIFENFGEEKFANKIANRICKIRKSIKISSTLQLAKIVKDVIPNKKIHSLMRIFQALRIAVNNELENLTEVLRIVPYLLKNKGRIIAISFHSLEDRIIKRTFSNFSGKCFCYRPYGECVCNPKKILKVLTPHPIVAGEIELSENISSRTAKLRVAEKI